MNIQITTGQEIISECDDSYGAGGAFPPRGVDWAAAEIENAVAMLIVPDADDSEIARQEAGEIQVKFSHSQGEWPAVTEWTGTVESRRGLEAFTITTR